LVDPVPLSFATSPWIGPNLSCRVDSSRVFLFPMPCLCPALHRPHPKEYFFGLLRLPGWLDLSELRRTQTLDMTIQSFFIRSSSLNSRPTRLEPFDCSLLMISSTTFFVEVPSFLSSVDPDEATILLYAITSFPIMPPVAPGLPLFPSKLGFIEK